MTMTNDKDDAEVDRFRHFPMDGDCTDCNSSKTVYVGETLIDEQCCRCGRIVGGGYLAE